ncbi:hypothetical protein KGQ71_02450 [Patescibacteria group bacterium]|nr:hypothetical protein [Patescibacteria group bacterium]
MAGFNHDFNYWGMRGSTIVEEKDGKPDSNFSDGMLHDALRYSQLQREKQALQAGLAAVREEIRRLEVAAGIQRIDRTVNGVRVLLEWVEDPRNKGGRYAIFLPGIKEPAQQQIPISDNPEEVFRAYQMICALAEVGITPEEIRAEMLKIQETNSAVKERSESGIPR